MPPGSSNERQTVKPLAACSAANSWTVLPPLTRVSFRSTPRPEAGRPGLVEDQVELDAIRDLSLAAHFDALLGDRGHLVGLHHCAVGVQPIRVSTCARCGRRGREPHAESGDYRCDQ